MSVIMIIKPILKHNQTLRFFPTGMKCKNDSQCDNSKCEYCTSDGLCRQYDSDYCKSFTCGVGDGDCDNGQCPSGLVCGSNNFLQYHSLPTHCADGKIGRSEVCIGGKSEKGMISYFIFLTLITTLIRFQVSYK